MVIVPEDVLKVVLAVLVGGLVGFEREFRDKAAGFRTMIFICVGATLFTLFSVKVGGDRIASTIVTGIGFLGAGVIMREAGRIAGLTTAAMIWLTAALGMGLGLGEYLLVAAALALAQLILWLFPALEQHIGRLREHRTYEVVYPLGQEKLARLRNVVKESGLRLRGERQSKEGEAMRCYWDTYGLPEAHDLLVQALFDDPAVREFRFT
jgi:putative Mg2+ transporter-C (MgtC) family protein